MKTIPLGLDGECSAEDVRYARERLIELRDNALGIGDMEEVVVLSHAIAILAWAAETLAQS